MNEAGMSRRELLRGGSVAALATSIGIGGSSAQALPLRQDITTMDDGKLSKVQDAVKEMMARSKLKANDPKGWLANAEAHKIFCAAPGNAPSQVHFCYWFLP